MPHTGYLKPNEGSDEVIVNLLISALS